MKRKNLFMSMLAMAGMLFATSCSQDELLNEPSAGDYVNAKFTIGTTDGIGTRATIGNGTKADVVTCAVFDANGDEMTSLRETITVTDKKATYDIRLVKGQAYRIAFFAYNEKAAAYDVTDMKNIKVNGNQACNIENRDAFTAYTEVTAQESMQSIDRNVTLYRPFAQLNLGAYKDDIKAAAAAGVTVTNSQIKVSNVYTAFNAYDDVVTGETTDITFALNDIPTEDLEVDINENNTIDSDEYFEYLALNYLLVGDKGSEKSLTDVEFVWETADGKTNNPTTVFKNIPVQRNYRTNILGYLLTNPAQFNIIIDERFEKPDYIVYGPWDGVSVNEPSKNSEGAYVVSSPEEWAWFANKSFTENTTVEIRSDIDMNGGDFMMTMNAKNLTINGNGFTISNINAVKSTSGNNNGDAASVSLFYPGNADSKLVINDLTFENVKAHNDALTDYGHNAAVIASYTEGDIELNNVHVYNADVKAMEGVGVLVGLVTAGTEVTINNCSVNDSKVSNLAVENESGYVAAMVGKVAAATVTFTGTNSINDTEINAYYAANRGENSIDWVAVKRVETATISGAEQVTVTGGSMTKVSLESVAIVSNSTELATALSNGKSNITLAAGNYELSNPTLTAESVTITGADKESCIVKITGQIRAKDGVTSLTLKNLTTDVPTGLTYNEFDFAWIHYLKDFSMVNCKSNGRIRLNVHNATIDNCEFNVTTSSGFDGYAIQYQGATNSTVKVSNSVFNTAGKAIVLYNEGTPVLNLDVDGCTFKSSDTNTDKAAIQMHTELGITGTIDITNSTATGFVNKNNGLWNELNNNTKAETDKFDITVDGNKVH